MITREDLMELAGVFENESNFNNNSIDRATTDPLHCITHFRPTLAINASNYRWLDNLFGIGILHALERLSMFYDGSCFYFTRTAPLGWRTMKPLAILKLSKDTVPGPERTNQRMAPGPCADTSVKSSVYHTGPLEMSSTTRYPNTSLNTTSWSTKANTIDLCSTEATIKDVSNTSAHVSNKSAVSNTCGSERRQPCTTRSPCPVVQPSGLSITIWLIILVIALLCSYLGSIVAYQVCRKAGYCGCTRDATVKYVPF
ncbi:unnamed protein product [Nesidiocoris tenuis]|uniref:Uncharacterized protein n=1 Tax=Nesidiocoris tenuis TaxID=355587 RepID=A0A6H5GTM5_9HEMI|nr:unnamed protein product [Nesidiocoris tenuis]